MGFFKALLISLFFSSAINNQKLQPQSNNKDKEDNDLEEDNLEDSQGDGLETLSDDDVLFPEEF